MSRISGHVICPTARFCECGDISASTKATVSAVKPMSVSKTTVNAAKVASPTSVKIWYGRE